MVHSDPRVPGDVGGELSPTARWSLVAGLVMACFLVAGLAVSEAGDDRLSWPEAVALGALEGATEYLPVSSTAHLVVAQELLGLRSTPASRDAADAYAVVCRSAQSPPWSGSIVAASARSLAGSWVAISPVGSF